MNKLIHSLLLFLLILLPLLGQQEALDEESPDEELEIPLSSTAQQMQEVLSFEEDDFIWQAMKYLERSVYIDSTYQNIGRGLGEIRSSHGITYLSPLQIYHLLHSLNLQEDQKLLLVGDGTDYETAVLENAGVAAFRILDYNGSNSSSLLRWQGAAPFQAILLTQETPRVPPQLLNLLDEGGICIVRLRTPAGISQWLRIKKLGLSFQMDLLNPDGTGN